MYVDEKEKRKKGGVEGQIKSRKARDEKADIIEVFFRRCARVRV